MGAIPMNGGPPSSNPEIEKFISKQWPEPPEPKCQEWERNGKDDVPSLDCSLLEWADPRSLQCN